MDDLNVAEVFGSLENVMRVRLKTIDVRKMREDEAGGEWSEWKTEEKKLSVQKMRRQNQKIKIRRTAPRNAKCMCLREARIGLATGPGRASGPEKVEPETGTY